MLPTNRRPTSPGEMLLEEFLLPGGVSPAQFAAQARIDARRLQRILAGRLRPTGLDLRRIARATRMSTGFWQQLQGDVNLWEAGRRVPG